MASAVASAFAGAFHTLFKSTQTAPPKVVYASNWTSPEGDTLDNLRAKWTIDKKRPVIFWIGNAHGAMNDQTKPPAPNELKKTDMDVKGFAIAGNGNQCGLMGLVNLEPYEAKYSEFNGKGIDYCIPALLTSLFYDCKQQEEGGMDLEKCYGIGITKVIRLYQRAGHYFTILRAGGFQPMRYPTRYHYYQLTPNPKENERESGLPQRAAAGDARYSQSELYGIWILYTNIDLLYALSLTSNSSSRGKSLLLPPKLLNRTNMAGRKNRTPIGALHWMNAIHDLAKYDSLTPGGEINKSRTRALTALNNLWKTRQTNLHDILDIFTPFNIIGMGLGLDPIMVRTIDVTCRSNIGPLPIPDPFDELPFARKMLDSVDSYTSNQWVRDDPPVSRSRRGIKSARFDQFEDDHEDAGDNAATAAAAASDDDDAPDADDNAEDAYLKAIQVQDGDEFYDGDIGRGDDDDDDGDRGGGAAAADERDDGGGNTHRPPKWVVEWNASPYLQKPKPDQNAGPVSRPGGAKRKYSRKRNTRTRNRNTRTRNRNTRTRNRNTRRRTRR